MGIMLVETVGPLLPTPSARSWLCDRVVPYLMDSRVLATGLVERRTRHFGVRVLCDPYVYVHRKGYWCGVFYEEELEAYLLRNIGSGDTVIDVGMNVGHVTILAAARVGPSGKVLAFEPNVDLARQVKAFAERQSLQQVLVLPFGLGSAAGFFDLKMEPCHSGGATLRDSVAEEVLSVKTRCEVRVGDETLRTHAFPGKVFLKIDVEGFEIETLVGLEETLGRVDHAVIEVSPDWLKATGVTQLFEIMKCKGLYPYQLAKNGLPGAPVLPSQVQRQINVLFLRRSAPGSAN